MRLRKFRIPLVEAKPDYASHRLIIRSAWGRNEWFIAFGLN